MIDRKNVIKGLRLCSTQKGCHGCPYESMSGSKCSSKLKRDALELLKEQEPVRPVLGRIGNFAAINDYTCPVCGTDLYHHQKYCDECGRKVKWDESC